VVVAVAMLGATLALLALVAAAQRVIGWILVAGVVAGLLHPLVTFLQRRMPRGLAVAVIMVVAIGSTGAVVYGLVDDVQRETRRLQQAAPERARQLERSERFGKLARDLKLEQRTRRFVQDVPARLRGGTPAEALRAAATRGVAFLATGVLTIFLLLHGPRIARAGVNQVRDPARRDRLRSVAIAVYRRAFGYASATLVMAVAAGLFAYALARWARVPGPAPLGIWVGLWDLVPVAGAVVGALPIVVLAGVASGGRAVLLALAFVAYQLVEDLVVQRRVERSSLRLGPFLTLAAGLVGVELSGVAGALLLVLAAASVVVVADELQAG
jgi:predicted PurR-regulated permease PerM